jgi:hypothetical protein
MTEETSGAKLLEQELKKDQLQGARMAGDSQTCKALGVETQFGASLSQNPWGLPSGCRHIW